MKNFFFKCRIIIPLIFAITNLSSQNIPNKLKEDYAFLNNGDWSFFQKDYPAAYKSYNKIINNPNMVPLFVKSYIKSCIKLDKKEEAEKYIYYSISVLGNSYKKIKEDEGYGIVKDDPFFEKIESLNDSLLIHFYTLDKIESTKMIEHYFRMDYFMSNVMPGITFEGDDNIFKCENYENVVGEIKFIHDTTYTKQFLNSMIQKYGFPNSVNLGEYYYSLFIFLFLHNPPAKSTIDSALYSGKLTPTEYANIFDKFYAWDFKTYPPKLKNNYFNLTKIQGEFIIGAIDDIENVDFRRSTIGLMPLWQYSKIKGYKLSDEYVKVLDRMGVKYK